ncbi:MAG: type II toxin-antitoxin system Phd/YefM family antitoxin [Chloroflexota bacterium]
MSETVGIRELKNDASRIIERVERGEAITVTRRGEPVATIVSSRISPGLARLIANGTVRPGNGKRHLRKPVKLRGPGPTAADYVSEGRR